jgi:hypothetical protein
MGSDIFGHRRHRSGLWIWRDSVGICRHRKNTLYYFPGHFPGIAGDELCEIAGGGKTAV